MPFVVPTEIQNADLLAGRINPLSDRQQIPHHIGKNSRHLSLNELLFSPLRMPAICNTIRFLGILSIDQTKLATGYRMENIFRKPDILIKFNKRKSPFSGESTDRRVIHSTGIVPMSTENNIYRLTVFIPVISGMLIELLIITMT